MNHFLDDYTLHLIKENFLFISILVFFLIVTIFFIPVQVKNYYDYQSKIKLLEQDINQLARKKVVVSSIDPQESENLIQVLNTLIPMGEDYFSMLSTLENISAKTGFRIVSYSIKISEKPQDKIVIKVSGEGASDSFLKFLESYQYKGGRLITMDNIQFSPGNFKSTLELNFYTKDIKNLSQVENLVVDKQIRDKIKKIGEEIQSTPSVSTTEGEFKEIEYVTKENPFTL